MRVAQRESKDEGGSCKEAGMRPADCAPRKQIIAPKTDLDMMSRADLS